jgi:uncharacterized membrane protein YphA (DoxX/SURF4 family)
MKSETDVNTSSYPVLHRVNFWGQLIARFVLALFLITYGIAKLLGTQFIQSGMTLDEPLSEISGFELTWSFFGYSTVYSHFIAAGQIFFASLLLFDRTKRLGMLGLLPIILNIVLVNYEYNISSETMIVSCVFLALNSYLVFSEFGELKRFFWDESVQPNRTFSRTRISGGIRAILLLAMIGGSWLFISSLKSLDTIETPVAGDWTVRQVTVNNSPVESSAECGGRWKKMYFEPSGIFGILTDCGILQGKYQTEGSQIKVRFNPQPTWRSSALIIEREQNQATPENGEMGHREFEHSLSSELVVEYELASDRSLLKFTGRRDHQPIEITLVPWKWNKY